MSDPAEPPQLTDSPPRPAAATRVALGLFLFGFVQLAGTVGEIFAFIQAGSGSLNLFAPFSFLPLWLAAWLVWKDRRVIWPILYYLSALGLGGSLGSTGALLLFLPGRLVLALAHCAAGWFWLAAGYGLAALVLLGWLCWETGRARGNWSRTLALPSNRWLQPRSFALISAVPSALVVWGVLALVQGPWTRPAVERARAEYGAGYDYFCLSYTVVTGRHGTRHDAIVLAYSDSELKRLPLRWED